MPAVRAGITPTLMAALLAVAASLLANLSPPAAGLSAALIFLLGRPVLAALQERLPYPAAALAATALLLLALLGVLS